eukprot:1414342-Rhodomonas_salina.2
MVCGHWCGCLDRPVGKAPRKAPGMRPPRANAVEQAENIIAVRERVVVRQNLCAGVGDTPIALFLLGSSSDPPF